MEAIMASESRNTSTCGPILVIIKYINIECFFNPIFIDTEYGWKGGI